MALSLLDVSHSVKGERPVIVVWRLDRYRDYSAAALRRRRIRSPSRVIF